MLKKFREVQLVQGTAAYFSEIESKIKSKYFRRECYRLLKIEREC